MFTYLTELSSMKIQFGDEMDDVLQNIPKFREFGVRNFWFANFYKVLLSETVRNFFPNVFEIY